MVKFVELNLYISTTKVRIFLFGTDNFILELQYTYISTYVVTIILDTPHHKSWDQSTRLADGKLKFYFQV